MNLPARISKANSMGIIAAAYLAALCGAILFVRLLPVEHPLVQLAIGDLVATIIIFLFSFATNNSSMYDPYWSVKPAVFAVYYLVIAAPENPLPGWGGAGGGVDGGYRMWIVSILMVLYSIRLTSNFFRDWSGLSHEDWRYRNFRKQFPKQYWLVSFFGIHLFPTIMVYLGCLPLYGIWEAGPSGLNYIDLAGMVVLPRALK